MSERDREWRMRISETLASIPLEWYPPPPEVADLPAEGNQEGDFVQMDGRYYAWVRGSWVELGRNS